MGASLRHLAAARDQVEHLLSGHRIEVNVERDVPVRVDPRLTATALAHLLENAAQYTPSQSMIGIQAQIGEDGLLIHVRDQGTGIAPADMPHLFERFYRGDAARARASGTGMGLWIVRGLLAAEGGRAWAENCPEGGARFSFDGASFDLRTRTASETPMTQRTRILLVDDEVAIQRAVGPLLRSRGYDVDVAGTGAGSADAGRLSARQRSSFSTWAYQTIEGTEVCRRVRATSDVPIIVLSARESRELTK